MTDTLSYSSASPRYGLPFLFAGQAQKEFFVNSALEHIDMLLHPEIEGVSDSPPPEPAPGACWIVGHQPADAWSGKADHVAGWAGDQWIYVAPREGLSAYDKNSGQQIRYKMGVWQRAAAPNPPSGGTIIDQELRQEFENLIDQLQNLGVIG